jgi:hypothetical protein
MLSHVYDCHDFDSTCNIRLLELKRNSSDQAEWSFAPHLDVSSVEPEREYAAISYEWGTYDLRTVTVDATKIQVRSNLADLLCALPKLHNKQSMFPTLFWIDSICINQNDNHEKQNQIRLLKNIYTSASCVISWLGRYQDCSNSAMRALEDDGPVGAKAEAAVFALLNRRYWTRLWMVQEVVLGRRWLVACGRNIIDGVHLTSLFQQVSLSRHTCRWRQSKAFDLINERAQFCLRGPLPLIDLMLRFYKLGSKYKADKIHALLALCTDSGETGKICELLALSDNRNCKRDPDSVQIGVSKEIYRLHCLTRASKDMQFGDIASFIKGVLSNSMELESLQLTAQRLRCTRMVIPDRRVRIEQMATSSRLTPFVQPVTTQQPVESASEHTPWRSTSAETATILAMKDSNTLSKTGRQLELRPVEWQEQPYPSYTAPYMPSHLPALLVNVPSKAHTSAYYTTQELCKENVSRHRAQEKKPLASSLRDSQNPT